MTSMFQFHMVSVHWCPLLLWKGIPSIRWSKAVVSPPIGRRTAKVSNCVALVLQAQPSFPLESVAIIYFYVFLLQDSVHHIVAFARSMIQKAAHFLYPPFCVFVRQGEASNRRHGERWLQWLQHGLFWMGKMMTSQWIWKCSVFGETQMEEYGEWHSWFFFFFATPMWDEICLVLCFVQGEKF